MRAVLGRRPLTFWAKIAGAAALVGLADAFFWKGGMGATLGVFALAWVAVAAWTHPETWRDRRALAALALALGFGAVLIDHPSLAALGLGWTALTAAVLLPRTGRFDDVWRWLQRLVFHGAASLLGPLPELRRLARAGRLPRLRRGWRLLPILALPTLGGLVFLWLFASANPVISDALGRLRLPALDGEAVVRAVFWGITLVVVWAALRPRRKRKLWGLPAEVDRKLPGVTPASVTLSLVVFNALFALQNGLDLAFLWSGAGLPEGVTLAEYAHRGAYPLIATALLAGLFVLVALSPGSETARRPWVRRLVVLWVGQNVVLVASTMLRTVDYIEVYSLTPLRIAALAWMGLVAVGLLLICWRMLRRKSTAWLLKANALAAGVVLAAAAVVDLHAVSASWNVRHAREAGGRGAALDVCYLRYMGRSAVVPLLELEARTPDGAFRDRLTHTRRMLHSDLEARQARWRSWTWQGARQLEAANALERRAGLKNRRVAPGERDCDGVLQPPTQPTITAAGPIDPATGAFTPAQPAPARPMAGSPPEPTPTPDAEPAPLTSPARR